MTIHTIPGHGGVPLHVREWGPADAPAIVLIHGWSQHHLCWRKQIDSALRDRFRLIALDLRGHGASGKPEDEAAYDNAEPWAGDLKALIDALGLDRPVLVGWSMGGRVIADYLSVHGDGAVGGIVTIGSPVAGGRFADPEGVAMRSDAVNAVDAYSDDQALALPAIVAFVRECSAHPIDPDDFATIVGFNMLATPLARRASRVREYDHGPVWAAVTRPVLLIQGAKEKLCTPPAFRQMVAALNDPQIRIYEDDGHMAFWESAERFNRDLAEFAQECAGGTA